jgi:hypothetical protein
MPHLNGQYPDNVNPGAAKLSVMLDIVRPPDEAVFAIRANLLASIVDGRPYPAALGFRTSFGLPFPAQVRHEFRKDAAAFPDSSEIGRPHWATRTCLRNSSNST